MGAGRRIIPGWTNVDLMEGPGIDISFDACYRWPFDDNSVGMILANHMLEHLHDPMEFFREAHRVLIHGGRMEMALPYGGSTEAWADPTHKRPWFPASFCFLQPGWDEECGNPQHDTWRSYFIVESVWREVHVRFRWLMRWPLRPLGVRIIRHLWDAYTGMMVALVAIKDPKVAEEWTKKGNRAQGLVCRDYMMRHVWENRQLKPGEKKDVVFFSEGSAF